MAENSYKAALEDAKRQLASTTEGREAAVQVVEAFDADIIKLRRVIVSLSALCGEATEMETIGITEACRTVMKDAKERMRIRDVKDGLAQLGFDLSTQKNADASVMAVLTRLVETREIRRQVSKTTTGKMVTHFLGPQVPGENFPPLQVSTAPKPPNPLRTGTVAAVKR